MKEHAIQPCEMAIKEITHLSKATINNLRSKVCAPQLNYKPFYIIHKLYILIVILHHYRNIKPRGLGVRHALEGTKRCSASSFSSISPLSTPRTPNTPITPNTPNSISSSSLTPKARITPKTNEYYMI